MPGDSIREKVLQRIQNLLAAIQSGLVVEPSNALPEPTFLVMDNCDDQDSVDGWIPSDAADTPTLNTTIPAKGPGAINLIKTAVGITAIWTKTFAAGFDSTSKVGVMLFRPKNTSKFSSSGALTIRFGNDASNYYERAYGTSSMSNETYSSFQVNIDGGDIGGPVTKVGTLDKTDIKWLQVELKLANGTITLAADDAIMDWWVLFDTSGWTPIAGSEAPEIIFDNQGVIGTYSIGFGHFPGSEILFGIIKLFEIPFDGTGGEIEAWMFVKDKTKLSNTPPVVYALGVLVGHDILNWFGHFLFYDDIKDQVNDRGSGWNRIIFDPLTESDLVVGSPSIDNLSFFAVGGNAASVATEIPVGDMRVDFLRIIGLEGVYNLDMKRVYRYSISSQQTAGNPSIMMAALNEDQETEIYPVISSRLVIGIDTEIELPSEALLDQELGRAADDIQVALASQQELWGIARYIKVRDLEFHVREGTHTGILTMILEVGFSFNQLDPTKQGV